MVYLLQDLNFKNCIKLIDKVDRFRIFHKWLFPNDPVELKTFIYTSRKSVGKEISTSSTL